MHLTYLLTCCFNFRFLLIFFVNSRRFLPRDAMHKRGLCRHAVSVCASVRLSVKFVHSVKTNKGIFEIFSPSGSHSILVFPYQTSRQYSDENPLTRATNTGGVGRNRDSGPISGFTACCLRCYTGQVLSIRRCRTTVPQVVTLR